MKKNGTFSGRMVDDDTFLWMKENVKQFIIRNVYADLYTCIIEREEWDGTEKKGQATISKTIAELCEKMRYCVNELNASSKQ